MCTANIQKGQTKDVYTKKYKYKVKILTDAETTEKKHAEKTRKRNGSRLGWVRWLSRRGNRSFMKLSQHEDAFKMFCYDPLMKAVFKDVPCQPSISGGCNENKL